MDGAEIRKIVSEHLEWQRKIGEFIDADSDQFALEILDRHPELLGEQALRSLGQIAADAQRQVDQARQDRVESRSRLLQEYVRVVEGTAHIPSEGQSGRDDKAAQSRPAEKSEAVGSPQGPDLEGRRAAVGSLIQAQIGRNRLWSAVLVIAALTNAAIVGALATGFAHNVMAGLIVLAVIALFIGGTVLRERMALSGLADDVVPTRALLVTERVARMYGIPSPQVQCWGIDEPNALAHGKPGKAVVVYTRGMLELLDDEQLEAVAAHELAHVVNGDSQVGALSFALLSWARVVFWIVSLLAVGIAVIGSELVKATMDDDDDPTDGLLRIGMRIGLYIAAGLLFVSGLVWAGVARMVHLATIRQREWMADATAAQVTGNPHSLAEALDRLRQEDTALSGTGRFLQPLCIAGTPRLGRWWDDLSDTHPSIERRIARLRGVADGRDDRRAGAGLVMPILAAAATLVVAGLVTVGVLTSSSATSEFAASSAPAITPLSGAAQQNAPDQLEPGSSEPDSSTEPGSSSEPGSSTEPASSTEPDSLPAPDSPPPRETASRGPDQLVPRVVGSIAISNPSGMALSRDGRRAYVTQLSGAVSVIDTSAGTVTASIPLPGNPIAVVESLDGRRIYVSNWGGKAVSVIDTTSNRVIATIPVGSIQWGIAMAPNGQRVYVALRGSGTVAVIDTATNRVVARVRTSGTPTDNPVEVAVAPDGRHVYATNRWSATLAVINTDTESLDATIPVQGGPNGVAVTSDGRRLVVTNEGQDTVSVIQADSRAVANIDVEDAPITAVMNGTVAYVVNRGSRTISVVDTTTRNILGTVNLGGDPGAIRLAPDGRHAYVTNAGSSAVIVLATGSS